MDENEDGEDGIEHKFPYVDDGKVRKMKNNLLAVFSTINYKALKYIILSRYDVLIYFSFKNT